MGFKQALILLAKDAAVTFGPNHCPTLPTDDNIRMFGNSDDGNGGVAALDAEDYKGLSVLLGVVLLIGGGLVLLALGKVSFAEAMALIGPPVTYLFAKGAK